MNLSKNFKYWNLILILILGIILRLLFINKHDFWFDENFSLHIALLPIYDLVSHSALDNTPPFYYLLLKIFTQVSTNELWLRSLSLITGVLSIFFVYLVFKKKGKQIALLTTLFYSVSPLMIYFSVETRMYQLLSLEVLGFVFILQRLVEKYSLRNFFVLIFLGIIGVYTHYYFFLVIIISFIFILLSKSKKIKTWIVSFFLIFLGFLPWLIIYIQNSPHPGCWCFNPLAGTFSTFISFSLNGLGFVTQREFLSISPIEKGLFILISSALFALFLIGITKTKKDYYYLLIFFGSFAILTIISLFKPIFSPRSLLILAPFFYFFASKGLFFVFKRSLVKSSLTVIILLGTVLLITLTNPILKGEPLMLQSSYIKQNFKKGDVIAHTSLYTFYSYKFYLQKDQHNYLVTQSEPNLSNDILANKSYQPLSEITSGKKRLWFILNTEWTNKSDANHLRTQLMKTSPILSRKILGKTEIILFDLKGGFKGE